MEPSREVLWPTLYNTVLAILERAQLLPDLTGDMRKERPGFVGPVRFFIP